jgi:aspartyl-tRNA(Asn)/glutamyl-tRNA(Gln) amidotransferase subunit C
MQEQPVSLSREEVLHIAQLARVGLSPADVARFQDQLSHILDQFDVLRQIDTTDVPPTSFALPLENVMRDDTVEPSCDVETVLANAPLREGNYFRVRRILE